MKVFTIFAYTNGTTPCMQAHNDLVYDIGFHNGDDTHHYLRSGYRVVAVEANPVLADKGRLRFKKEIAGKQLTLLNVGIANEEKMLPFYRNHRLSEWSSFDKATGTRNNTPYDVIEIPCTCTESLFAKYGVPYYMKVDIEGFDHYCLTAIPELAPKPAYVSCEAVEIEWLTILKAKGYTQFKVINQADGFKALSLEKEKKRSFAIYLSLSTALRLRVQKLVKLPLPYGSSGPFAEATDGEWLTYEKAFDCYTQFLNDPVYRTSKSPSWFDFHARL